MITAPGAPAITFASGVSRPPKPSPSHHTPSAQATEAPSASLTVGRHAMPSPMQHLDNGDGDRGERAVRADQPARPPDRSGDDGRVAASRVGDGVGEAVAEHEDLDLQDAVEQPQPSQAELEHPPPSGGGCQNVNRHALRQQHAVRSSSTSRSKHRRPRA